MKKIIFVFWSVVASNIYAGSEWVNGELLRIDESRNRVMVKHDYIPSIQMEAMSMLFDTSKNLHLGQYQAGDKVRFQFKVVAGSIEITSMEKMK